MPRANRLYAPGYVWHITHRCHNRDFLLKFERDRLRWKYWLFQARKRFGLSVLNYIATSNHVHLLVRDTGTSEIAQSLQLIAGRVAQEYNSRKARKGAFWEDRYFATAVASDRHLLECLVYIDLNMVRAGVISHPSEWPVSGFNEIQNPPMRYRIIDTQALCSLGDFGDLTMLQRSLGGRVENELSSGNLSREKKWTESKAVGPDDFIVAFENGP